MFIDTNQRITFLFLITFPESQVARVSSVITRTRLAHGTILFYSGLNKCLPYGIKHHQIQYNQDIY